MKAVDEELGGSDAPNAAGLDGPDAISITSRIFGLYLDLRQALQQADEAD